VSDSGFTHLDPEGQARMVDVGDKRATERRAVARAVLSVSAETARMLADGTLPKGDALAVARIAGIQAAKRTPELIPLCHQVALAGVDVDVRVDVNAGTATVEASARAVDRTGVEMEALVAASVAALSLYDMVKAVERGATIDGVALVEKTGGIRGDWRRDEEG
jgi:cyclic pyranopterin monophosphate synthase